MSNVFTVLKNPITATYETLKENVLSNAFEWYFYGETVSLRDKDKGLPHCPDCQDDDAMFLSHTIVNRPNINTSYIPQMSSIYLEETEKVVREICEFNDIDLKCIYRINFNLIMNQGQDALARTPFHRDHEFNHKILLVYLTGFTGGATVADVDGEENVSEPEENGIVSFDGKYYHAARFPNLNHERRIVLNCTYEDRSFY